MRCARLTNPKHIPAALLCLLGIAGVACAQALSRDGRRRARTAAACMRRKGLAGCRPCECTCAKHCSLTAVACGEIEVNVLCSILPCTLAPMQSRPSWHNEMPSPTGRSSVLLTTSQAGRPRQRQMCADGPASAAMTPTRCLFCEPPSLGLTKDACWSAADSTTPAPVALAHGGTSSRHANPCNCLLPSLETSDAWSTKEVLWRSQCCPASLRQRGGSRHSWPT